MKILIIEEEKEMAKNLQEKLIDNYIIDLAFSGEEGGSLMQVNEYDLILLDYRLPDIDGITVSRKIRKNNIKIPILMLATETGHSNEITALDAGVDDYITKPFLFEKLHAHIRALLRRSPNIFTSNILKLGDLSLDRVQKTVTRGKVKILLKRKEFQLLEYFMRNTGKVITREMILEHMWDHTADHLSNTIEVHIKYLRDQLDKPFKKKLLKTVHGFGYKMEA
jgi:DNA-binding response OmpR family regulator